MPRRGGCCCHDQPPKCHRESQAELWRNFASSDVSTPGKLITARLKGESQTTGSRIFLVHLFATFTFHFPFSMVVTFSLSLFFHPTSSLRLCLKPKLATCKHVLTLYVGITLSVLMITYLPARIADQFPSLSYEVGRYVVPRTCTRLLQPHYGFDTSACPTSKAEERHVGPPPYLPPPRI